MEMFFVLLLAVTVVWYLGLLRLGRKAVDTASATAGLQLDRWVQTSVRSAAKAEGCTDEELTAVMEAASRADKIRDLLR